ncbi:hypothetical protein ZYGNAAKF_CDS0156 [Enterococcus phage VRE9_2]
MINCKFHKGDIIGSTTEPGKYYVITEINVVGKTYVMRKIEMDLFDDRATVTEGLISVIDKDFYRVIT